MKNLVLALHPILGARDITNSVKFYQELGFELLFVDDPQRPRYAAMSLNDIEIHLQWADETQWLEGIDRPAYRFLVADVDALFAAIERQGTINLLSITGSPWARPGDTPWGTREFHLRDPGDNCLHFYHDH